MENWSGQNYPVDSRTSGGIYSTMASSGLYCGGYPSFAIIGYQNKVYYNGSGGPKYDATNFYNAMNAAINSFPTQPLYIANPITDKQYSSGSTQQVDLTSTFASTIGQTIITKTVESNSNLSVLGASISGNILTLNASSFNPGTVTVKVRGTDQLGNYAIDEFLVTVINTSGSTFETFNDGNFNAPAYTWTLTKSATAAKNWVTTTTSPYEGAYCAGTDAALAASQWCAIETTVNFTTSGSISFYTKTSSELNYDFLTFYIDGVSVEQWSGTTAWTKSTFTVTSTGNHTFKFEYSKDTSVDGGSDQVWLDNIEVLSSSPVVIPPAPVLATPSNASTTADTTPTFDWNDVAGSTLYDILVDNNSDFSSPEVNTSVPASTYTVATKALANGTYYWKTKVTSASGPYSEPWNLTIGSTVVPGVPANVTTSIVSGNVYINWDDSPNATSYDIYTSTTPYGTYSLLTNVISSEYTFTPSAEKVFFYIKAKNATK